MRWMNHKKSRVMDFFRRIDKDQDGKITRQEFIDGILASSTIISCCLSLTFKSICQSSVLSVQNFQQASWR